MLKKIAILVLLAVVGKVSAGTTSNSAATPTCFQCPAVNGTAAGCIYLEWECDGFNDCPDGADEHERCRDRCHSLFCTIPGHEAPACQPHWYECDGNIHCENGEDEHDGCKDSCRGTWCESTQMSGINICLASYKECNGRIDCADGFDEVDCEAKCEDHWCAPFDDLPGKCITDTWKCDGEPDCADQSDELGCGQQ